MLYNLPKSNILRLQINQNRDARILTKTPRCDHITEVLFDLHWLKIEERILWITAQMYLCELIEQLKSSTNTRLADDAFLLKHSPLS